MEKFNTINVFSYNIWTDNGKREGKGAFASRIPLFREKFLAYKPDLIGFQETMPYQRQWLMDNLDEFEVVGIGRGKNLDNESNVIAYRKDRFDLVFLETFWLSDTPHKPGSRFSTDQSDCPRICTTVTLRDRVSGVLFRHYNTHLDHVGAYAQAQGVSLILNRIANDFEVNPLPVILTGDFNVTPDSEVYKSVMGFEGMDQKFTDATADIPVSFHGYHPESGRGSKIDFVFTTLPVCEGSAFAAKDGGDGIYLSDHYPVGATLVLSRESD